MIPYGRQSIDGGDIDSVVEILESDFLTQGPAVPRFEEAICHYTGAGHAVAANSGTSALHLACLAVGLEEGDWLWTSPVSFVASANCGLYCGARVDFIDIDPVTWNLSVDRLQEKLALAEKTGRLPKVLVAVHLGGLPCDLAGIRALSEQYGFYVIEDACHALGGAYRDEPVGNCRYSDIATFSFHPVKAVTTGEGGMAVTNDQGLAERMALLRTHGITREPRCMTRAPDGPWYYQQIALGFNYRMTDIQAALGISQMRRLDAFVVRRHEIAAAYDQALASLPVKLPCRREDRYSGLHLYVIRLRRERIRKTHEQVFRGLRERGIGVNVHYIPIHLQPFYEALGFRAGDFPEAERYYEEAISLPMFPALSDDEIGSVVEALEASLS